MSGQYFGERVNNAEIVERTDQNVTPQEENQAAYIDSGLADPPEIYQASLRDTPVQETPMVIPTTFTAPTTPIVEPPASLLSREESERLRMRWNEIQGKFVDEPRAAVQQADALVSEVIAQITSKFANEHSSLDGQWNQGNDVSTEDLRKIIQSYRSFFNRLVL